MFDKGIDAMNGVRFLLFFFLLLHCQIVFSDTNTLDTKTLEELAIGSIGNIDKAGDCEKDFEDKYGKLISLDDNYSLLIENKISDCDSRFTKFADFESSTTRDAIEQNIGVGIKTYYRSYNHADNIILIYTNYYNRTSPYNNSKFSFPLVIHIVIFSAADNKTVFRSKLPFPEGIPCSWSMSKYYRPYFLGIHFLKNDFIPDIYVLFGPGGSGNFASIFRYHYNPSTKTWDSKKIWHDKTRNIYAIDRRKVIFSANDKDFLLTQEDYWP